jgi:AcrR family transcriptional regulator
MLNDTPLNKITVKEISVKCEINRNTFYYYYSDVYALLSEIFQVEMKKVIENYNDTFSWEQSFLVAAEFALENKRAIYHVYYSLRREVVENYICEVAENVMTRYVEKKAEDIPASKESIKWIAYFYQCALTEILLRWIVSGMEMDPKVIIGYIGQLFDGNIEISLKRSLGLTNPIKNKE